MFCRLDYLLQKCTYEEYYSQFLNDRVISRVGGMIGKEWIIASKSPTFDDVPIHRWEATLMALRFIIDNKTMAIYGESWSSNVAVCIAKLAAEKIRSSSKKDVDTASIAD